MNHCFEMQPFLNERTPTSHNTNNFYILNEFGKKIFAKSAKMRRSQTLSYPIFISTKSTMHYFKKVKGKTRNTYFYYYCILLPQPDRKAMYYPG